MGALDTIAWARSQVGAHEDPWGSNRVRYWRDIGLAYLDGFAWCGAFAYEALARGGADLSWTSARRFVDTAAGLADATRAGIFYTDRPQPGDPVWFNLDGRAGPEHVGIVTGVANGPGLLAVSTIDGNIADQVKSLIRSSSTIIGCARITYPEDDMNLSDKVALGAGTQAVLKRITGDDISELTLGDLLQRMLGNVLGLAYRPELDVDELAARLAVETDTAAIKAALREVLPELKITIT